MRTININWATRPKLHQMEKLCKDYIYDVCGIRLKPK